MLRFGSGVERLGPGINGVGLRSGIKGVEKLDAGNSGVERLE